MMLEQPTTSHAVFDHTAHAVPAVADVLPLYVTQLGGMPIYGGTNPILRYRALVIGFPGGGKLELLEPTAESSFLSSFFAKHPLGGLHHITFRVRDLAASLDRAASKGYQLIGIDTSNPEWLHGFIHPHAAHGALVQLVQTPDEPKPLQDPQALLRDFGYSPKMEAQDQRG